MDHITKAGALQESVWGHSEESWAGVTDGAYEMN